MLEGLSQKSNIRNPGSKVPHQVREEENLFLGGWRHEGPQVLSVIKSKFTTFRGQQKTQILDLRIDRKLRFRSEDAVFFVS